VGLDELEQHRGVAAPSPLQELVDGSDPGARPYVLKKHSVEGRVRRGPLGGHLAAGQVWICRVVVGDTCDDDREQGPGQQDGRRVQTAPVPDHGQ